LSFSKGGGSKTAGVWGLLCLTHIVQEKRRGKRERVESRKCPLKFGWWTNNIKRGEVVGGGKKGCGQGGEGQLPELENWGGKRIFPAKSKRKKVWKRTAPRKRSKEEKNTSCDWLSLLSNRLLETKKSGRERWGSNTPNGFPFMKKQKKTIGGRKEKIKRGKTKKRQRRNKQLTRFTMRLNVILMRKKKIKEQLLGGGGGGGGGGGLSRRYII